MKAPAFHNLSRQRLSHDLRTASTTKSELPWKLGVLPDWVRSDIEDNVRQNATGRLTPDVAALRSVSLSSKFRIQQERTSRAMWASVDQFHVNALARKAFWSKERQENGPIGPY